jgi:hypothetical protein
MSLLVLTSHRGDGKAQKSKEDLEETYEVGMVSS